MDNFKLNVHPYKLFGLEENIYNLTTGMAEYEEVKTQYIGEVQGNTAVSQRGCHVVPGQRSLTLEIYVANLETAYFQFCRQQAEPLANGGQNDYGFIVGYFISQICKKSERNPYFEHALQTKSYKVPTLYNYLLDYLNHISVCEQTSRAKNKAAGGVAAPPAARCPLLALVEDCDLPVYQYPDPVIFSDEGKFGVNLVGGTTFLHTFREIIEMMLRNIPELTAEDDSGEYTIGIADFSLEAIFGYIALNINPGNPALDHFWQLMPWVPRNAYDDVYGWVTTGCRHAPVYNRNTHLSLEIFQRWMMNVHNPIQGTGFYFKVEHFYLGAFVSNYLHLLDVASLRLQNNINEVQHLIVTCQHTLSTAVVPPRNSVKGELSVKENKKKLTTDLCLPIGTSNLIRCATYFTRHHSPGRDLEVAVDGTVARLLENVDDLYNDLYSGINPITNPEFFANNLYYKLMCAWILRLVANLTSKDDSTIVGTGRGELSPFDIPITEKSTSELYKKHIDQRFAYASLNDRQISELNDKRNDDNNCARLILQLARTYCLHDMKLAVPIWNFGWVAFVFPIATGDLFTDPTVIDSCRMNPIPLRYIPNEGQRGPALRWVDVDGKPQTLHIKKSFLEVVNKDDDKGHAECILYEIEKLFEEKGASSSGVGRGAIVIKERLRFMICLGLLGRGNNGDHKERLTDVCSDTDIQLAHVDNAGNPIIFNVEDYVDLKDYRCPGIKRDKYKTALANLLRNRARNPIGLTDVVIGGGPDPAVMGNPRSEHLFSGISATGNNEGAHALNPYWSFELLKEIMEGHGCIYQEFTPAAGGGGVKPQIEFPRMGKTGVGVNGSTRLYGRLLDGNIRVRISKKFTVQAFSDYGNELKDISNENVPGEPGDGSMLISDVKGFHDTDWVDVPPDQNHNWTNDGGSPSLMGVFRDKKRFRTVI